MTGEFRLRSRGKSVEGENKSPTFELRAELASWVTTDDRHDDDDALRERTEFSTRFVSRVTRELLHHLSRAPGKGKRAPAAGPLGEKNGPCRG